MELLAPPPLAELPAEALLARLRSRRAAIDPTGTTGVACAPGETLAWLLPRLDHRLRRCLTPYLEVVAMRGLVVALRHRLAGAAPPPALLDQPWLAGGLRPLVESPGEAIAVVARVEMTLADTHPFAHGLTAAFRNQGPGAVETQLTGGMLGQALASAREPVVLMTLRFLVDLRNLLAVLRHWRWQLRTPPPFLAGGEVPEKLLKRIWASSDQATFGRMAGRLNPGAELELEPRAAEQRLLTGLSRRLQRAGRDPLGVGVVLDTLWRGEIAARNRALHQGSEEFGAALPHEAWL